MVPINELKDLDCLIIAVAHKEFRALTNEDIGSMFKDEPNDKSDCRCKGVRNKMSFFRLDISIGDCNYGI